MTMARATGRRRGRPVDHDSETTKATILAVAQQVFGTVGFAGASMERIATAAGLTVRAIYHYFPSKRALFDAATEDALERFGAGVLEHVFVHERLIDRVHGYLEVFRSLHRDQPDVVPFIGMVLVDGISRADDSDASDTDAGDGAADPGNGIATAGDALQELIGTLVDDAIRRGEVSSAVDRDGAVTLLVMVGRGLCLSALSDAPTFAAMLDELERLVDGTLFAPPAPSPASSPAVAASTHPAGSADRLHHQSR